MVKDNTALLRLSEDAANRLQEIISQKPEYSFLRLEVIPGGCQGFNIKFTLDSNLHPEDQEFVTNGQKVVCDKHSLQLVEGSVVEYSNSLMGKYFWLQIAKAKSKCSCGSSFSI